MGELERGARTEDDIVPPGTKGGTPPPGTASHPGFATTALGPADVRDTPRVPSPLEAATEDVWIGQILSNVYRVEAKIGEGGMGAVYAARHVHLNKQYAIKVLSSAALQNATAIDRLKQEAVAASSIDHDNIVDVTNFDQHDGSVFIVMELLRGESLAARLGRGPIVAHDTVRIAQQICGALGAAHARGIVHRDLKPENVFLSTKGGVERVKVLDFGISKVKSAEAEGVRMTRTGQLVGTPLYMSPEQARGETEIDRRVDVYALGVMLYEMLTGVPPFDGRNYFELLWKHGNEAPLPLEERNPNVFLPPKLGAVVMKALAKDREARWQSMEELAAALYEAVPEVPVGTTSLPPPRASAPSMPEAPSAAPRRASTPDASRATLDEPAPLPTASRTPLYAGIALAGLVGVAALAWLGSGGVGTSTPPATTTAVAPPPPTYEPPMPRITEAPDPEAIGLEPQGIEPPALVTVSFGSTPPGADVRRDGNVLCTTPCMQDLPRGEAITVVLRRAGYFDETRELTPDEGATLSVQLRERPRARPTGASTAIKTQL
ncbi:MAG: protein kinase [Sandaracinus sp.]